MAGQRSSGPRRTVSRYAARLLALVMAPLSSSYYGAAFKAIDTREPHEMDASSAFGQGNRLTAMHRAPDDVIGRTACACGSGRVGAVTSAPSFDPASAIEDRRGEVCP